MKNHKVFVAGHNGMAGSAVLNILKKRGYTNIVTKTRSELDLINQESVNNFFNSENIDHVVLCAAKVGGILANSTYRGDFIYENLQISANIIKSSQLHGVSKLINLGSSCIYPRDSRIPIKEESLLTGSLEETNEPYALAKISALKMCEAFNSQYGSNFYSLMPCNLYGPRDNFDLKTSHVLPAFINKVHREKLSKSNQVEVWGSGKPLREFLYVEDLANAVIHCLENIEAEDIYSQGISHINCGSDEEVSISELMYIIQDVVGYDGKIIFDKTKPDGTFRKKMDNRRLEDLGFTPSTSLKDGIKKTYSWFKKQKFII